MSEWGLMPLVLVLDFGVGYILIRDLEGWMIMPLFFLALGEGEEMRDRGTGIVMEL